MAVCGMQLVDLTREPIKILGICFSYNMNLMNQKKKKSFFWVQNRSFWDTSSLQISLSGTSYCFPNHSNDEVAKIQNFFIWNDSYHRIK